MLSSPSRLLAGEDNQTKAARTSRLFLGFQLNYDFSCTNILFPMLLWEVTSGETIYDPIRNPVALPYSVQTIRSTTKSLACGMEELSITLISLAATSIYMASK